jgi:hypothetical protein
MPEKRDVDAEQDREVDRAGALLVDLLRTGLRERLWGTLTVTYSWKAGVLSKRTVNEGEETLLMLPKH